MDGNIEKGSDTQKEPTRPNTGQLNSISIFQLFRYSTPFEIFLDIIGLVAAAAAGAAQPLMTLLFGRLTQDFVNFNQISERNKSGIPVSSEELEAAASLFRAAAAKNASYLVYIGVGMFVCTYIFMYIWVYTGETNAKRIREKYLQSIIRQDIAYFDTVGAGEVATRIQTDTHLVQTGMSEKIALVANCMSAFACGYILAYARNWRLALAMTSILPGMMIVGIIAMKFSIGYKQVSLKHVAAAGTFAEEVISTIRTAQAFGTQHILSSLYTSQIVQSKGVDVKAALGNAVSVGFFFFMLYGSYALAFSFGTTLINSGHATVEEVLNVFMSIFIGSMSLVMISPEMEAISNGRSAAAKLYETIDRVPEIDSADPGGLKPVTVEGRIVFEDVRFTYPSRPTVEILKGISITFEASKIAALVGESGSGKSTIVSLIERFYDSTSGSVKFDGHDIRDLNIKWLRSHIGYVAQEPVLFGLTVKQNIAYGLLGTVYEHASEVEKDNLIWDACVKANAHDFIAKLPHGYDTFVGERGLLLSGGQKQRIAIARAIVSDPKILLLDEATSALDTQSEGIVQQALDKASKGRTTIIIAHRLSTIKDADVIHVMGSGCVLESGSHEELVQKGGAYFKLVETQRLRDNTSGTEALFEDNTVDSHVVQHSTLHQGGTMQSLSRQISDKGKQKITAKQDKHTLYYLFIRMGRIARDQWRRYAFGAVFAIIFGMAYPAFGIVFSNGINGFSLQTNHERRKAGDRTALWMFIISIVSTVATYIQNHTFGGAAARLTSRLRTLGFKSVLRQDVEFFDRDENSTGSLVSKLSDNPQKVDGVAGITLGAIVQTISTVITGSIVGTAFIWKVGLIGVACTPALLCVGYIRLRIVELKDQANQAVHEESAQVACEAAGAIRTVAALTREDDCIRVYSQSLDESLRRSNTAAIWSTLLYAFTQALSFFVIALVFWYGSILVSRSEATLFQFFIGLMSTTYSAIQAGNVFMYIPDVSAARGAASDIITLLDSTPEIDVESNEEKTVSLDHVQGRIELNDVYFRYPTRPTIPVLQGLTLNVEPGSYVALVGGSGSGKSTIIQLLERFYNPLSGNIMLDGEPIAHLNVQDYRKHLALVSQEPTLYSGTIRFNVLLGATKPHSEVTQEEIEDACRDANILEFIQTLPQGFETEVGGKGSQLSGGQKQRIAIARALIRKPKVLLLDEATSALDSASEKVVQAALDKAARGRTTIAIAHRLSTVQNADKIYFIKEGTISDCGTHDELMERRGDYYEFVQLQALGKK